MFALTELQNIAHRTFNRRMVMATLGSQFLVVYAIGYATLGSGIQAGVLAAIATLAALGGIATGLNQPQPATVVLDVVCAGGVVAALLPLLVAGPALQLGNNGPMDWWVRTYVPVMGVTVITAIVVAAAWALWGATQKARYSQP